MLLRKPFATLPGDLSAIPLQGQMEEHMAMLSDKCSASFTQGYFGEYMAILQNDLLAIVI